MISFEEKFVDIALSFQGSHYIWGGHGHLITKGGRLTPHPFTDPNDATKRLMVFDCSGLITTSLWMASGGKIDLRTSHGSLAIWETFPEAKAALDGVILCYPGHVSIDLGRDRVVDAHGGDSTTLTVLDAMQRRARVEVHRINRNPKTLLGMRRIPLDISELKK